MDCGIVDFTPRPGRTRPNLDNPSWANRTRHDVTVAGPTPISCATLVVAIPSAARSSALARSTSRCAAVCDRDNTSSICR